MTGLTPGDTDLATASSAAWADRHRAASPQGSRHRPIAGFFLPLWHRLTRYWLRRSLRTLSDEQLRDAGIDPVHAGRGRAADARPNPNIGSGY